MSLLKTSNLQLHKAVYILLFLATLCSTTPKSYEGYKVVRFVLTNEDQKVAVTNWLYHHADDGHFIDVITLNKHAEIVISPSMFSTLIQLLKSLDIKSEIVDQNIGPQIQQVYADNDKIIEYKKSFRSSIETEIVGVYPRYNAIQTWMNHLKTKYSNFVQLVPMGKTYEGRDMNILVINTDKNKKKPIIFIDAGIHAREWIAPASLIYVLVKLVTGVQNKDAAVMKILDKYEIHALPVVNPDGYEYTFEGDRFWRKTRRPNENYPNCIGADPNRNFEAAWGTTGVDHNCRSDIYPGTKVFSEIEAKNLANYLLKVKSNTKLYLSLHAYGQFWLTPYGYARTRPADYAELDRVAKLGAEAIKTVYGLDFKVGPPYEHLYESSGGSDDWAKMQAGIKYVYTLELRPSYDNGRRGAMGFNVPPSEILKSGAELFAALTSLTNNMI